MPRTHHPSTPVIASVDDEDQDLIDPGNDDELEKEVVAPAISPSDGDEIGEGVEGPSFSPDSDNEREENQF